MNTQPALRSAELVPGNNSVNLYLAGVGNVGAAFFRQLKALSATPQSFDLIGYCTSTKMRWLYDEPALHFPGEGSAPRDTSARPEFAGDTQCANNWKEILRHLVERAPRPLIFVDATGSLQVARLYPELIAAGIHIATPSKLANTRDQQYFDHLQQSASKRNVQYRYETTVGAGLPVIQTVQDLLGTGDRIRSLRGVLSGTLSYLFSQLRRGQTFSEALRQAESKGYTEPDIRDDLSGEDVARKFMILVRTLGVRIEREEVSVESLVPEEIQNIPREQALENLSVMDDHWRARFQKVEASNRSLQYIGHFDGNSVHVGIREVRLDSPFATLKGTDNLLEIHTDRYASSPLVIQGPGAGPEVTAAGLLSDVLKIARSIG